jgi:hypothetical protein
MSTNRPNGIFGSHKYLTTPISSIFVQGRMGHDIMMAIMRLHELLRGTTDDHARAAINELLRELESRPNVDRVASGGANGRPRI